MERKVYLEMKPVSEARDTFLGAFSWQRFLAPERILTADALGRVTSEPVFSLLSSPGYNGAAMDGYAVRAEDTFGAAEERPVKLVVGEEAHAVNTGQPLPAGCDAVIMIEHVQGPVGGCIEIVAAAFPLMHVRKVGEDIVANEMLLAHHHVLGAADVSALLASGVTRVSVLERPRVAIVATGSELVHWSELGTGELPAGRIVETNSTLLACLVREQGGVPDVRALQADDPVHIRQVVEQALDGGAHMVLVNAGASAGSHDYTVHVLGELGRVLVHGIAAMPGKPTILAEARARPVVGTPGYPVSAWVCFDQFVRPALQLMQGQPVRVRETIQVTPARKLASKLGVEEFVRVHLGRVGDRVVATPLKRGAGAITSLTRADGIIRIGADSEGVDEGLAVQAELLRPREVVDRTLVVVGSHDVTLDLLADHIRTLAPQVHMSASNVGSLAGLVALRDGRSHAGGTHLLDARTGEYNVSWVKRTLGGLPARLVTLAHREQGLIVARGNPRRITGLADLAREDVVFVNRQAGAGTRVLFDHEIGKLGIDPCHIRGYIHEEFTHMAVAVLVKSGAAHAGMGILAAAIALGLDFVPVATERYDLCMLAAFSDDPRICVLLEALASPAFARKVKSLGGYDVTEMGRVAWEG